MMDPWTSLRTQYPWPETAPDVPLDPQGFFDAENRASLTRALALTPTTAPLILELGTWKGSSARWMLEHSPAARVVCVDLWTPAETYARMGGSWTWLPKTPHLYETCQRNLWSLRDRCVLVRARTADGLRLVAAAGLLPDVVYIDAGHTFEDVTADLRGTLEHWPPARPDRTEPGPVILGDDYNQAPVRQAVEALAPGAHCLVADEHSVWRLVPAVTKWGDYRREYGQLEVAGQVVLDLGAEQGTTAQFFLARGATRVLVSEIDPRHRERLARAAAADARIVLLPPLRSAQDYADWIRQYQPAAVKCDIEGAEAYLLQCPAAAFAAPRAYAMETHSPELHAALTARLQHGGYRVELTREFTSNPKVKVVYAARA